MALLGEKLNIFFRKMSIESIPRCILNYIFSFVTNPAILRVCKKWNKLATSCHLTRLKWKRILEDKYVSSYIKRRNMPFEVFKHVYPQIVPRSVAFNNIRELQYAHSVGYTHYWNVFDFDDLQMFKFALIHSTCETDALFYCDNLTVEKIQLINKYRPYPLPYELSITVKTADVAEALFYSGIAHIYIDTDDLNEAKKIFQYYPCYDDVMGSSNLELVKYAVSKGATSFSSCYTSESLDVVLYGYENKAAQLELAFKSHNIKIIEFVQSCMKYSYIDFEVDEYDESDIAVIEKLILHENIKAKYVMYSEHPKLILLALEYGAMNFRDCGNFNDLEVYIEMVERLGVSYHYWLETSNPEIAKRICLNRSIGQPLVPVGTIFLFELLYKYHGYAILERYNDRSELSLEFRKYIAKNHKMIFKNTCNVDLLSYAVDEKNKDAFV